MQSFDLCIKKKLSLYWFNMSKQPRKMCADKRFENLLVNNLYRKGHCFFQPTGNATIVNLQVKQQSAHTGFFL